MPTKGDDWTRSEEQTLETNWNTHSAQEIADMLPGRTLDAVYAKHSRMKEHSELSGTTPAPSTESPTSDDVKRIVVSKEDIKEGYEFNEQPPKYKNQRTAVIRVWENKKKASLAYHETGSFYHPGEGPMFSIGPAAFVDEGFSWQNRMETRSLVREETNLEPGTDAFHEKVNDWKEEAEEVFWAEAQFNRSVELNYNQKHRTGIDGVVVEYR